MGTKGTMTFNEGQPSAGSTAPAWTLLLAVAYAINAPPLPWAYLMGTLFAILSAALAGLLSYEYFGRSNSPMFVGALCLLEWHLAWAALSGMEITLSTFLTLAFFYMIKRGARPAWVGALTGIAFLVRPESVLLAGIYAARPVLRGSRDWRRIAARVGAFSLVFAIVIAPLLSFNFVHSGKLLPNTVTAKYLRFGYPWSVQRSAGFVFEVAEFFFLGPFLLLAPFFLSTTYQVWRDKREELFYPLAWCVGLVGLYAIALPVIYHHGRYLMVLIPWVAIFGIEGLFVAVERFRGIPSFWRVYKVCLFAMVIVLWINHAATYALQVELLKQSHMRIASWINANTSTRAVIATHDIGILGYMTEREIVDLAALITPEVIPILLDQQKLAEFSMDRDVDYFVLFSGYYQELLATVGTRLAYSPASEKLRSLGEEPLEVHQVIEDSSIPSDSEATKTPSWKIP